MVGKLTQKTKKAFIFVLFWKLIGGVSAFATLYKCYDTRKHTLVFTNLPSYPSYRCVVVIRDLSRFKSFDPLFFKVGKKYGIDGYLLKAIAKVESNFNSKAISRKGAIGLMQLMPHTARLTGVRNPFRVRENLEGAARYLKKLIKEFKSLPLAIAAYNAGPKAVKKYKGIPPYRETRNFVKKVLYYYYLFKH